MPTAQPFVFQLDKSISLEMILERLFKCYGLVYLENHTLPFIGIYPKKVWRDTKANKSIQRKADFSYYVLEEQPKINFYSPCLEHQSSGFNGGYISFISYDFAKNNILTPQLPASKSQLFIGEYDIFLKQRNDIWCLHVPIELKNHLKIKELLQLLEQPNPPINIPCSFYSSLQPRWNFEQYKNAFYKVQDYLHQGDCYQINLTQEFQTKIKQGRLLSLLPHLMNITQAPYSGYIQFDDFELLSCSPELFIEFDQKRLLKTRPIKGTLPRGSNPSEDEKLKQQLTDSEKDQAENLMIVDLLRNDLSVYAETGSVKVPKLFEIESFAQVHHMVSEIHATLKPEVNPFEVLMSALPGGSITGAPKIRAMEIIDEIEGNHRGAYCGSLGYFNYDGTGRFNILIRSIQRYGDDVSVWAGGGITVASNIDAEYQETLDKVSAILDALNQYAEKPNL